MPRPLPTLAKEVREALESRRPIVALESTVITHGLPWPQNLELARRMEVMIRAGGACPATVAVLKGEVKVGLTDAELEYLARASGVVKVSRRDYPVVIAQKRDGATTVAGTQVTFDGIPSAIIYTRNTLVSVMVPYELTGRISSNMVVTYNGVSSTPLQLRLVDSAPGIYTLTQTGSGQGAILNQNGTVNGTGNPEVVGNYIQIFGTGEGQTSPQGVDGLVLPARLPLPVPNLLVEVSIGGIPIAPTDINYAGEAPGIISGVIQVNAKIPAGVGTGPVPVVIKVGGVASQANVTVSVR